jgi:hypothetical protein
MAFSTIIGFELKARLRAAYFCDIISLMTDDETIALRLTDAAKDKKATRAPQIAQNEWERLV